ncbi:MAG TPA: TetR/AcrR family transcriptional regulator [Pyrinomonadaceae bacterium]|mgnify:CR=1 FL=1|nr:TetR/AcrR family transcriptional regulator [Pyrinomonadaceae bacterium]
MRDPNKPLSTREAILEATSRALATVGYKKMKIEDLAREAGIGKGSVYLHFSSKEDIALAHIDRIISHLRNQLDEIEKSGRPAAERLEQMMKARVMERFDSVQSYPVGLGEMLVVVRDRLLERRQRYFEIEASILARVIAEGTANGEFAVDDPAEAANAIVDATNSLLPFNLSPREIGERDSVERRLGLIVALLIDGLRYRCQ